MSFLLSIILSLVFVSLHRNKICDTCLPVPGLFLVTWWSPVPLFSYSNVIYLWMNSKLCMCNTPFSYLFIYWLTQFHKYYDYTIVNVSAQGSLLFWSLHVCCLGVAEVGRWYASFSFSFWGTSILTSTVIVPMYILSSSIQGHCPPLCTTSEVIILAFLLVSCTDWSVLQHQCVFFVIVCLFTFLKIKHKLMITTTLFERWKNMRRPINHMKKKYHREGQQSDPETNQK